MPEWSLSTLLASLHEDIEQRLSVARKALAHPGTKGDASEGVWLELLNTYLPERYRAAKAHVIDSESNASDQIDVVVFDRQYSPFIFNFHGQIVVPAESVYAVFETKQTIFAGQVNYAQDKVQSVRKLKRTSLPIPHAGGVFLPKPLPYILGGLLTFESDWNPALGDTLLAALASKADRRLDLGCVAAHGIFQSTESGGYLLTHQGKPATAFLFELIARLQTSGTVPMIDVRAYAKWLAGPTLIDKVT
jgi:hypothetical protein